MPFIPLYLKDMGVGSQSEIAVWSGLLFSAGFLMLALAAPFWGAMADRWGRKLMVIRATVAGAVVLVLMAFAQTPYQLLILRLLHGVFSGFISSATAMIAAETPDRSLGFGLGIFQSSLIAGCIAGPFFGVVL